MALKSFLTTEVISDGAEGIILESVLEGYAEYYSADLSEKVIRGITDNALKCKYNGGTLPLGYVIYKDGTKDITFGDIKGSDFDCTSTFNKKK